MGAVYEFPAVGEYTLFYSVGIKINKIIIIGQSRGARRNKSLGKGQASQGTAHVLLGLRAIQTLQC